MNTYRAGFIYRNSEGKLCDETQTIEAASMSVAIAHFRSVAKQNGWRMTDIVEN
jgi:hypothetical protein